MRAERLISTLLTLQRGRPLTASELSRQLGISVRTVFRDIEALSAMGVPVYTEPGRGGGIRLMEGYATDLTGLSSGEAEALALVSSPELTSGMPLAARTRSAMDKLAAAVPGAHQLRAQHARNRLLFDTRPWFRSVDTPPVLEELRRAVWTNQVVEVDYQSREGRPQRQTIEPHALVIKVDTWYVIARARREMRVYRVSRIQSLTSTGESFARDARFDLQGFWYAWRDSFEAHPPNRYEVRLFVTPRARQQLLDRYGTWLRAPLEPLGNRFKRKVITLDLQREDIAMGVIFSLGDSADVIEPLKLRRKLAALARRVVSATG